MDDVSDRNLALPQGIWDSNYFLALAGILAAISPPLILLFLGGDMVTRKGAMAAYVETVPFLFALFLVLFLAGEWIRKRAAEAADSLAAAYATLIVPVVCVLITLTVINTLSLAGYMWAILSVHLIFILLGWFGRKKIVVSTFLGEMNQRVILLLPVLLAGIFWVWMYIGRSMPLPGRRSVLLLVVGLTAFAAYMRFPFLQKIRAPLRTHWGLYFILGLTLIGLIYQPELPFDRIHIDFILAPVNDVLHGKWLFIDSTSQYGVGVIYALAAAFRILQLPLSFNGSSFIVDLLFILQYAVLFLILKRATGNRLLSLAGIAAIACFNFLATVWPSMLHIPAQSPLRYGMIYLLLGIASSGVRGEKKSLRFLEWILLGIASLWSLETFFYTLLSVYALYFVAEVLSADRVREGLLAFGRRAAVQAGVIILCWGLWLAASFLAKGTLPDPAYYLEILSNYTVTGQYGHAIDFRSLNLGIMAAVYLVSIMAVLYLRFQHRNHLPVELSSLLVGISVSGLL